MSSGLRQSKIIHLSFFIGCTKQERIMRGLVKSKCNHLKYQIQAASLIAPSSTKPV